MWHHVTWLLFINDYLSQPINIMLWLSGHTLISSFCANLMAGRLHHKKQGRQQRSFKNCWGLDERETRAGPCYCLENFYQKRTSSLHLQPPLSYSKSYSGKCKLTINLCDNRKFHTQLNVTEIVRDCCNKVNSDRCILTSAMADLLLLTDWVFYSCRSCYTWELG